MQIERTLMESSANHHWALSAEAQGPSSTLAPAVSALDGCAGVDFDASLALVVDMMRSFAEVGPAQGDLPRARWQAHCRVLAAGEGPWAKLVQSCDGRPFSLALVTAALGLQIDPDVGERLAEASARSASRGLTAALAISAFTSGGASARAALSEIAPARGPFKAGLLCLGSEGQAAADGRLGVRIEATRAAVAALMGESGLHGPLAAVATLERPSVPWLQVIAPSGVLHASRQLAESTVEGSLTILSGPSGAGKTHLARAIANQAARPILCVEATSLPIQSMMPPLLAELAGEIALRGALVCVERAEAILSEGDCRVAPFLAALGRAGATALLCTTSPETLDRAVHAAAQRHLRLPEWSDLERLQVWEVHLPADLDVAEGVELASLASQFELDGHQLARAARAACLAAGQVRNGDEPAALTQAQLEAACATEIEGAGSALVASSAPRLRLADVVLPPELGERAHHLLAACRHQGRVLSAWGFGERMAYGKGIAALFDGPPGTGKTFLAEVVAGELGRPLFRVSLPDLVSKWVGETEKNIRDAFKRARAARAVLLFDEADALFASRSAEAKSSNDRYANMEVNLLLQEVERFPGVCLLTTNHFGALDPALVRRIQFRITFEPPQAPERERIWRSLTPAAAPFASDVDYSQLAQEFDLVGGHIKNAMLRAAYLAADLGQPISQQTLRFACVEECRAIGRLVMDAVHIARPS